MDTALQLRLAWERGCSLGEGEVSHLLHQSPLVKKLTQNFEPHPLFATFRVLGLSEIPYAERLPYTQKLIAYLNQNIATDEGFSCLGGVEEMVPCYNAMLLEAYCRLGLAHSKQAQAALQWLENYQLFERNQSTVWPYKGVCKHGGCLGKTPCYIGIGKTVRALITYAECVPQNNTVESLLSQGTNYILRHHMFQRLSDGRPISAHITEIAFPQSYALSLTDLVYIAGKRHLTAHPNCAAVLQLLQQKQVAENRWKIEYIYYYKGYVPFENKRKPSEWVSSLFPLWLQTDA